MDSFDVSEYVDAEHGLVRGEIFHSQEIYERELTQVFGRSWLFLAHDAMIPKAGDFIQTYMGEDPVVVVRQSDGSVNAFLNQCRHRGMRICRADEGNSAAFMCSFHGWTYDISGRLIHVPHEREAYGPGFDKAKFGPAQVPQLFNYKGFIFGNWDPEAPSFEDYLGDMAWYFDAFVDRHEGGLEPVATHKWVLNGNWKFNAEQPASDVYHGETTHASALQVLQVRLPDAGHDPETSEPPGYQFGSPYGHGTGFFSAVHDLEGPLESKWLREIRHEVIARIGQRRTDYGAGHGNIFPNFMFLQNGSMRVTHPRGPHEMEIWAWTFVPAVAPEAVKEERRVQVARTFSPGGIFEQDDAENWAEEQRILRGYMARQKPLVYTMQLGRERYDADGLPGRTVPHVFADEGARALYQHYADLMSSASWPDLVALKQRREEEARAEAAAKSPKKESLQS